MLGLLVPGVGMGGSAVAVTPVAVYTGPSSLAAQYLRLSLAACASWQAAVNAANAADALNRIYKNGLPRPANRIAHTRGELQGYRPYALVFTAERAGITKREEAMGDHIEYSDSGRLMLRIVRESPDSAGDEPTHDANRTFKNLLGEVIDELCDLAGQGGYLAITTITLLAGPFWPPRDLIETEGLWQSADLLVEW